MKSVRVYQNSEVLKEIRYDSGASENGDLVVDTGILKMGDIMKVDILDEF